MELNIKHESPVEYELNLPIKSEEESSEEEAEIKPTGEIEPEIPLTKECSVKLTRFDDGWQNTTRNFETFYACKKCNFLSRRQREIMEHRIQCPLTFDCEFCFFPFKSKVGLHQHLELKFKRCPLCKVELRCPILLQAHIRIHKLNGLNCDQCSYIAMTISSLRDHIKCHAKAFKCETCSKSFTTKYLVTSHKMQHKHGEYVDAKLSFQCEECHKIFQSPLYLRAHRTHTHEASLLQCDFCGQSRKGKYCLSQHLRTHLKVDCKICGESVTTGKCELT